MGDETKTFDALDVATITTGICMKDGMGDAQGVLEHVLGYPVWTHEMGAAADLAIPMIVAQWPEAPLSTDERIGKGRWREILAELEGRTVELKAGAGTRAETPVTSLRRAMGDGGNA